MSDISTFGEKDLLLLMGGQKYPAKMVLKSQTIKGFNGEDLYHVTAKHPKYGLFSVDCKREEIKKKNRPKKRVRR